MFDRRRTAPRRMLAERGGSWPLSLGLFLEVAACCVAMTGLIQGRDWWLALLGMGALLLAIPLGLRSRGVASWLASLIDLAVLAALIQLFYGFREVPGLIEKAMAAINLQGVPAAPLPALIFLFVLCGGALAVLLDLLAVTLRMPALTGALVGGVLVVPAVLQPGGLSFAALCAAAGAWFAVLWAAGVVRFGSRGGGPLALAVGASVTILAVIVAMTAPGFSDVWRSETTPGALPVGSSVNPLIDLSKNLREPVPVPVLQYTTTNPEPEYLQLTTLDSFNGTVWQHESTGTAQLPGDGALGGLQGLPASVSTAAYPTSISIQGLASPWVPVPSGTVTLNEQGRLASSFEPIDHTVNAAAENLAGDQYSTSSLDITATFEQVEAISAKAPSGPLPVNVQRDVDLPGSVPKIITETAAKAVAQAGATSPFDEAVALQDYFQNPLNGFTYSTATPDSIDGTSLQVVAKFLQRKEGYCIHFATAMAVMARVLGIPSRIAMGYLPGTFEEERGNGFVYQVQSSDLHAWPQLYFPGIGWLNFEPTVSRGAAPSYTIPSVTSGTGGSDTAGSPATQAAAPQTTPTAAPVAQGQSPLTSPHVTAGGGTASGIALLVLLAALISPFVLRRGRRRGRLRRLRTAGRPARLAWEEIQDTARDLGLAVSAAETPRAFAARIRGRGLTDARLQADLDTLLEQLERAEYGPGPEQRRFELADAVERVVRRLVAERPLLTRVRAALFPVSLLRRQAPGDARKSLGTLS